MKNVINYYYGLIATDIIKKGQIYRFTINGSEFLFKPCNEDINKIIDLYMAIYSSGFYCHEIVYNKENSPVTLCENIPYVLLKKNNDIRKKVEFMDIINYNIPITYEKSFNWPELWSQKIDYYEYQVNQFGKKFPLIRESFSYYDGMIETAISLSNLVDKRNLKFYLSHNRIKSDEKFDEFYNPINFVLDVKVRDVCEYFKEKFFSEEIDFNELENYIYQAKLTNDEAILFLARMLFPSYYFDTYDEIIQGVKQEEKILIYLEKVDLYEDFLAKIYYILKIFYQIPEIEWIKKI